MLAVELVDDTVVAVLPGAVDVVDPRIIEYAKQRPGNIAEVVL